MNSLILLVLLTLVPLIELRGALPLALISAESQNIPSLLIFFIIVSLNILLIFFVFFFLDNLHKSLLSYKLYKKFYGFYLKKAQKRIEKFERAHNEIGIYALFLFVAIPLPLTGAYSGAFISWIMNLDRKKSIAAISAGVFTAGVLIYLGVQGVISFLS